MAKAGDSPRAIIHKRILQAATDKPDASIDELATAVSGASDELVERVLEQYGDPGEESKAENELSTTMTEDEPPIDITALSEEQRETLQAIIDRPDVTQRELAEDLGVTAATVSQRLGAIEGFDWADRGRIVAQMADLDMGSEETDTTSPEDEADESEDSPMDDSAEAKSDPNEADETSASKSQETGSGTSQDYDHETVTEEIEQLQSRMTDLEATVEETATQLATDIEERAADGGHRSREIELEDRTLLAKLVRAAIADDSITEDEEVCIIEALL